MEGIAGPVALALVGLWVAYLVPGKLRHRQQLLESRVDDRYSEALRVVAVTAGDAGPDDRRSARVLRTVRPSLTGAGHAGTTGLLTPGKGTPRLTPSSGTGGSTVDRPHATPERTTADAARRAAQARAARTAAAARRAAAAKRRAVIATVLAVATIAGWAGAATFGLAVGVIPTVLLVSVLGLGRRAVIAGRRADETLAQQISTQERIATAPHAAPLRREATRTSGPATGQIPDEPRQARSTADQPLVTGRAVYPSDTSTQMFELVVADGGEDGDRARHATSGAAPAVIRPPARNADEPWAPVPVPPPTYTMKPAAPRREPAPLGEVEGSTAVRAPEAVLVSSSDGSASDGTLTPEPPVRTSGSIDLNAVLAKRRASGE